MIKRFAAAFVILAATGTHALAADMLPYSLPEADASIQIPGDSYVITSSTRADDPLFKALYIEDAQAILDNNAEQNVILDAVSLSWEYEILITLPPIAYDIQDLNQCADEELNQMINETVSVYEQAGITVLNAGIYRSTPACYIMLDISQPTSTEDALFYCKQFYTIFNSQEVSVTLNNLLGEPVSEEQNAIIHKVADSLSFHHVDASAAVPPSSANAGASLTELPTNILSAALVGAVLAGAATLIHNLVRKPKQTATLHQQSVQPAPYYQTSPSLLAKQPAAGTQTSFDPFWMVAASLVGITDQGSRDEAIADALIGHTNPYTGAPITCEAEWDHYVQNYYNDKDIASTTAQVVPAAKQLNPIDRTAAPDAQPPALSIRYCRLCGAKLHADNKFCESCGAQVKPDEE